jgi:MFS family permease
MIMPILVPYLEQDLHATPVQVGLAAAVQGAAAIVVGTAASRLTRHFGPRLMTSVGSVGLAIGLCSFALAPSLGIAVTAIAAIGGTNLLYTVGEETLLQTHVEQNYLGRVFGALFTAVSIAMLLAALLPLTLATPLGNRGTLLVSGLIALTGTTTIILGLGKSPPHPHTAPHTP